MKNTDKTNNGLQMTDNSERLFNALETLRCAAWKSFDHRRTYEWKFAIAIWTALAISTGSLITQPIDFNKSWVLKWPWSFIDASIIGIILLVIHALLSRGWSKANDTDRRIATVYEKRMCELIGVDHGTEIRNQLPDDYDKSTAFGNYSHASQLLITLLRAHLSFLQGSVSFGA